MRRSRLRRGLLGNCWGRVVPSHLNRFAKSANRRRWGTRGLGWGAGDPAHFHLPEKMRQKTLSDMQNTRKMALKHPPGPRFDAFTRNSLFKIALIREILYSHSLLMRAILINLPQKIAKLQTNAGASNGRFRANIWGVFGIRKTTILSDSAGLIETPHPGRNNSCPSTRSLPRHAVIFSHGEI